MVLQPSNTWEKTRSNYDVFSYTIPYPNAPWCWNFYQRLPEQNHPVLWFVDTSTMVRILRLIHHLLHSGNSTFRTGKSLCWMEKSTICMVIFHSYVNYYQRVTDLQTAVDHQARHRFMTRPQLRCLSELRENAGVWSRSENAGLQSHFEWYEIGGYHIEFSIYSI